jgi:transcriptional regulator with XRE-family HTH domain
LYGRGVNDEAAVKLTGKRFGQNLRSARDSARLSGEAVAGQMQEAGFSFHQQTLVRIEAGEQRVKLDEAYELARICGTTVDLLTRPPALEMAARDLRKAARDVRESARALRDAAGRHGARVEHLRGLMEQAQQKGVTADLAHEIRGAMSALAEPVSRDQGPGAGG